MSHRKLRRAFRDQDIARYIEHCLDAGFTAAYDGETHVRVTAPDGRWVPVSTTQYSGTSTKRVIARLRRIGGPPPKGNS